MPTYEYVCPKCGHEFEQFQQMSAEPLKRCPKCGKLGVKRLVGKGAGLIFKGTGFYITDYKKTAAPKESGEGKPSGGESKPGDGKSNGGAKSGGESKSAESSPASSDSKSSSETKPVAKEKPKGGSKT